MTNVHDFFGRVVAAASKYASLPDDFLTQHPDYVRAMLEHIVPRLIEREILPKPGQSAALVFGCPKTSALIYDRVDCTSGTDVPYPIKCHFVSSMEVMTKVLRYLVNVNPWHDVYAEQPPKSEVVACLHAAIEKALQEGVITVNKDPEAAATAVNPLVCDEATKRGINMVPVFSSRATRDEKYKEGNHAIVVACLTNLRVVDEDSLAWEQVMEFRKDREAKRKYRRLIHWLDGEMADKCQSYIEDDVAQKLEDYEWALKKHGVETWLGVLEDLIDPAFLIGESGAAAVTALMASPLWALVVSGGLTIGNLAVSLAKRGLARKELGQRTIAYVYEVKKLGERAEEMVADYGAPAEMRELPADERAKVFLNRGVAYRLLGQKDKAVADFDAVIEMPDVPSVEKARALTHRGEAREAKSQADKALVDYTATIQISDAPSDAKARALVGRAMILGLQGKLCEAVDDFTVVIKMADAPADLRTVALLARGAIFGEQHRPDDAVADYSAAAKLPDAPANRKAQALLSRGAVFKECGWTDKEIADYDAVIEMTDAPMHEKANALAHRGMAFRQLNDSRTAHENLQRAWILFEQCTQMDRWQLLPTFLGVSVELSIACILADKQKDAVTYINKALTYAREAITAGQTKKLMSKGTVLFFKRSSPLLRTLYPAGLDLKLFVEVGKEVGVLRDTIDKIKKRLAHPIDKGEGDNSQQKVNRKLEKYWSLAEEAYSREDWDTAEAYFTKAIKAAHENGTLYTRRGWMYSAKARSAKKKHCYLDAIRMAAKDYEQAHRMMPNDGEAGVSVVEAETCMGQARKAADHAHKLFKTITDTNWRGVCCWLGAIASKLTGDPEQNWTQSYDNLLLAKKGLIATSWNTSDIEKYLTEYASEDATPDLAAKALQLHRSVVTQNT